MNLAVAVKSCHKDLDAGFHDAIRETWARDLKALGVPTYFFVGKDPTQQETRRTRRYTSGEVVLDCQDDYESLPAKTRKICQWMLNKMFNHIYLCDTDTFVDAYKLLATGYENYDYLGRFMVGEPGGAPFKYSDEFGSYDDFRGWASGGFGYFLSRKAADAVASSHPNFWAEDAYVGQVLAPLIDKKEIKGGHVNLDHDVHAAEHWNKKKITEPFTPNVIRLAYANGGFRQLFVKGLCMP